MVAYGIDVLLPVSVADGGTGETTAAAGLAALGGLGLLATTAEAGFALQDATPTILTWTAPSDGKLHRIICFLTGYVSAAETGGAITLDTVLPDGNAANPQMMPGGAAAGPVAASALRMVGAGETVSLVQSSALTAGAATVWAELWGL